MLVQYSVCHKQVVVKLRSLPASAAVPAFSTPCSHPTRTLSPPPPAPLSDDKGGSAKRNFKPNCQTEGEWWVVQGERNAEDGKKREESSPLLSFSGNWSGANINVLYCMAGQAQSVLAGHAWCNVALSLPPSFILPCQAKDYDDDNEKEEEEKENGTLRAWLGCSWYRFIQRRNEIAVCGHHVFSSRLPCHCCNRPDSRRQISPTSFEKHNFCKEKKKRCKFNPSGSFNLTSYERNKPQ